MIAAKAYVLADRAVRRLIPPLHAPWSGFWLGVLRRPGLHAVDQALYEHRTNYQSAEHNHRGLFEWERIAVEGHLQGRRRVAVLGAGGGREVLALWRMGFEPLGYECNPLLVEAAGRLLPAAGCPHPVLELGRDLPPPPGERFDAVMIGWSSYSLVTGRAERLEMLRGVRAVLDPGAPLMLSFFVRSEADRRAARVMRVANPVRRALRRPRIDPGDDLLPNFVHRFTRAEIEAELRETGFRLERFEPPGPGPRDSAWAIGIATG